MARYSSKNNKINHRYQNDSSVLSPNTANGLMVLSLLIVAVVSVFSIFELAGPFGRFWVKVLVSLFGQAEWLLPIYLIVLAAIKLRPLNERSRVSVVVGLTIALISVAGLIDATISMDENIRQVLVGQGGGYVGLFLRFPLETIFGYWVAVFILFCVFIASIVLTFDVTLYDLGHGFIKLFVHPVKFLSEMIRGFFNREDDSYIEEEKNSWRTFLPAFKRQNINGEEDTDEDLINDEDDEGFNEDFGGEPAQQELPRVAKLTKSHRLKPIIIDLPLTLLKSGGSKPTSGDIKANKYVIKKTLESFGVPVEMGEISVGPTVTQYTFKPEDGIKLSAITGLSNDLALALAAHPIRIEAPIPGRSLVGIEVPNQAVARVQLRDVLESSTFLQRQSNLMLGLGKDVAGSPWVADLERMPHLLVAGATGSGKSVALNSIIISLLYQNNPADLKFILVDPKRVEFSIYQHMPHLLTPIITEVSATVNALKWLLREMDRRFKVLSEVGKRNIQSYNLESEEKMPYIVLVIDELADLMVSAASEVEGSIIRLAQMSRAVGIHLILATQRPSVNVITGLIKANVTTRIAFSVASLIDSRTILDTAGAEKLLGRGDLLFVSAEISKPKRLQGAYVGDEEIKEVVSFLKQKASPEYITEIVEKQSSVGFGGYSDDEDPLYNEAEILVISAGKASASYLQRRLKVGYARAARLLDILESRGVIGPGDGAKPREVLMTREDRDMLESTEETIEDEEEIDEE